MKETVTLELIYHHLVELGKTVAGLVNDFENFTQITARNFDRLESRMGGLEGRMDGFEHRLDNVEIELHGVRTQCNRIEVVLAPKIPIIENDIVDVRTRITKLEVQHS